MTPRPRSVKPSPKVSTVAEAETILRCQSVWKLFGPRAAEHLMRADGHLTHEQAANLHLEVAVRDVNLSVRAGEVFVIMGRPGSGKSTLLRCMSRLIEPTSGRILFHGQDMTASSAQEILLLHRHKMGMVFPDPALLPHLTLRQNVAFPLELQGIGRAARDERAAKMIALLGLEGREETYPRDLTSSQQQRAGLARSLIAEPELWFLDNVFSTLDLSTRREMQLEFLRLQSKLKKTVIFTTDDFDEAVHVADRIAIMKDGAVLQTGTPQELVLSPVDDHVRELTRAVSRSKVIKVSAIMSAAAAGHLAPHSVSAKASVAEAAPLFLGNEVALRVINERGVTIGLLHKGAVVEIMLGGGQE